jgi:protein TonB
VLEDIEISETELDVNAEVAAPPPPVEEEEEEVEPVFFVAVEQQPEPIGGLEGIQKRIVYPEIAKRAGVQGRVFVKAYVDENGNVVKVELLKGIGAGCDEAAMEAVKNTKFSPGRQRGKPVKVQVSIPIVFKLN